MKHRIALFVRFLRVVLLVVMAGPFFCAVLLAVSLVGCAAQQIDAPLQRSPLTGLTLESLHERNPKALATTVCVLPDEAPAGTKFLLADARRRKFVSDQDRKAFEQFLPFADTIFEYNLLARSSSAALLGAALNLSCPDTFVVTHSWEEVAKGAPREQLVVRLSPDVHQELSSMVEQSCEAAEVDGTARRYIGQQIGKKNYVVHGVTTPQDQARMLQLLGIRPVQEPEPSSPPPPKSLLRLLMDTSEGQAIGGIAAGIPLAVVPGGTIAADVAIEAHLLPPGTQAARIGKACAELAVGATQIVIGCGGMGLGGGTSSTGAGAPVGVMVFVGALGLTATGMANCANGTRHLAIELWRTEDSPGTTSTGSLAQTGSSAATSKGVSATTQDKATTQKAPETSLTVRKDPPVTKTTTTKQVKGKQAAGAEPTPAVKGAKRGPKTDPAAPHNAAIRREVEKLKAQGNKIIAGGDKDEKVVGIKGGLKDTRRPDIIYRTPDGKLRGRNVGKTNADGTPVKREVEALDDLNNHSETPTDFVPYDR